MDTFWFAGLPSWLHRVARFFIFHEFLTHFQYFQQFNPNKCKSCDKYLVFLINYISQQDLACISSNRVANLRMQGCQILHFAIILCIYFAMIPHFEPRGGSKNGSKIKYFIFFWNIIVLACQKTHRKLFFRDWGETYPMILIGFFQNSD